MVFILFRFTIMESQVNKSKLLAETKEENEKKKKSMVKKDSFRASKESVEENDVIIISRNQK